MVILGWRRRWFFGVILGLAVAFALAVSYKSHRAGEERRVRALEQQRAETEARLESLQTEYEQRLRLCRSLADAGNDERRKLGCELRKSHYTFDAAGWRNDTVEPGPNRRAPYPIDIPNPAAPGEPLVPELNPKQR